MSQFILGLIGGVSIGATAGYLGTLMLQKRMALVAGPLGHLTLPGIALALLYGFDVSLGAFPFVILGIILIWLLEMRTKLPMEALTAVVFASGVALAFLFLPIEQAEAALVGDISQVSFWGVTVTVILCLSIFLVLKKIFSRLLLINISEDLAKVEGINIKKCNLLYLGCIAVIVALGAKLVGGLLTAALVAIPACAASNLSKNMRRYRFLAPLFGALSTVSGIFLFEFFGLPAGPTMILSATLIFLVSLIFKKVYTLA